MKVIHVIKRIEEIDNDIRELKKLEKSVKRNKSFTTPIFMSIEKQINILLGDRIKMLDLKIENPPEAMRKQLEGDEEEEKPAPQAKTAPEPEKKKKEPKPKKVEPVESIDDDEIPMLTQDQIDAKIGALEIDKEKTRTPAARKDAEKKAVDDSSVKILDIALEKGTLGGDLDDKKDKEKKVKFFRDNFPVE
ncbi:MAG TPA: hypothetical protein PLM53_17345 [Spirochaetota bacterium]|nr:hypothetical protein [Spirochaetota bacterium]HPC42519.1 hypothetical protein [Spirochaetota bacterium]HPL16092.1 hypothetical protein [Spirochaetota bacterium]HQF10108.1 hypothetical protein [Spirochaetota bacterium]HQH98863.1 hypothetical protein [Spirochaetota bacterium]